MSLVTAKSSASHLCIDGAALLRCQISAPARPDVSIARHRWNNFQIKEHALEYKLCRPLNRQLRNPWFKSISAGLVDGFQYFQFPPLQRFTLPINH